MNRWRILECAFPALLIVFASCDGEDGGSVSDPGGTRDVVTGDLGPADAGTTDPSPHDPGTADPSDPGGTPEETVMDPGVPDVLPSDPGADSIPVDPGIEDLGTDLGPTPDATEEPWPPEEPWWGDRECRLPPCDPGAPQGMDLSGLWTQTLTAVRHDCNPLIETLKPEIKPGTVTTKEDQSFTIQGTCVYSGPGGAVTGVMKGDTMINCMVMPPEQGVTAMPTGWITFQDGTGTGKSTVHLYGIPMLQPSNCRIEYDVAYVRQ